MRAAPWGVGLSHWSDTGRWGWSWSSPKWIALMLSSAASGFRELYSHHLLRIGFSPGPLDQTDLTTKPGRCCSGAFLGCTGQVDVTNYEIETVHYWRWRLSAVLYENVVRQSTFNQQPLAHAGSSHAYFSTLKMEDTFIQNVGSHKIYMVPHPRTRHSSTINRTSITTSDTNFYIISCPQDCADDPEIGMTLHLDVMQFSFR
jgi:hypothetical protein